MNFLQGTVFAAEWNATRRWGARGPGDLEAAGRKGDILMACCLVLGSMALVTGILPPLVNMAFHAVGGLFTEGV